MPDSVFSGKFRNQLCGCKSGKKYKRCCLPKFEGFEKVDNLWIKPDPAQKLPLATIK